MKNEQWLEIIETAIGENYRYRVYHQRAENEFGELLPHGGKTVVEIGYITGSEKGNTVWHPIATGEARVHPRDNYNRRQGRDMALRRALIDYREGAHKK